MQQAIYLQHCQQVLYTEEYNINFKIDVFGSKTSTYSCYQPHKQNYREDYWKPSAAGNKMTLCIFPNSRENLH